MIKNHITIKELFSVSQQKLEKIYFINEAKSLVNMVFERFLHLNAIQIYLNGNEILPIETAEKINETIEELKTGKPIQYIFAEAHFLDLIFEVNHSVLIPRQETEELVKLIIDENKSKKNSILDIGTGSGCIAVTLAKYLENSSVTAFDISEKALQLAMKNAERNNVNIDFQIFDILNWNSISKNIKWNIIASNPPYVKQSEKSKMHTNVVDFEPAEALFVTDENPLIFYEAIADFGLKHLESNGKLYLEVNETLANETKSLLENKNYTFVVKKKDIHGKDRIIKCIKS